MSLKPLLLPGGSWLPDLLQIAARSHARRAAERSASQFCVAAVVFILVCSTLGLELYGPACACAVLLSMMPLLSQLICPQKLAIGLQALPTAGASCFKACGHAEVSDGAGRASPVSSPRGRAPRRGRAAWPQDLPLGWLSPCQAGASARSCAGPASPARLPRQVSGLPCSTKCPTLHSSQASPPINHGDSWRPSSLCPREEAGDTAGRVGSLTEPFAPVSAEPHTQLSSSFEI